MKLRTKEGREGGSERKTYGGGRGGEEGMME